MWRLRFPDRIPAPDTLLLVVLLAVPARGEGIQAENATKPPAQNPTTTPTTPQPIPFSHKLHVQFFPDCLDCHALSADGWTMGYPAQEKCMTCHATIKTDDPAIKRLAAIYSEKKPVPWVQIYKVPDYVYFSHRTHIKKAKLECENCHGPVRERDVLTKEKPTSMQSCINCHKEKGAPVGCRTCHDSI